MRVEAAMVHHSSSNLVNLLVGRARSPQTLFLLLINFRILVLTCSDTPSTHTKSQILKVCCVFLFLLVFQKNRKRKKMRTEDESNAIWHQYDTDEVIMMIADYDQAAIIFLRWFVILAAVHCVCTFGSGFVRTLGYLLEWVAATAVAGIKYPRRFGGGRFWLRLFLMALLGAQGLIMASVICLIGPCFIVYYVPKLLVSGEYAHEVVSFSMLKFMLFLLTVWTSLLSLSNASESQQHFSVLRIVNQPWAVRVATMVLYNALYALCIASISLHQYAILMIELHDKKKRTIRNSYKVEGALFFKQRGSHMLWQACFFVTVSAGYLLLTQWRVYYKSCCLIRNENKAQQHNNMAAGEDDDDEQQDMELQALTTTTVCHREGGTSTNSSRTNNDHGRSRVLQEFLSRSHYHVLDLSSSEEDYSSIGLPTITRSYRRLALLYHPDRNSHPDAAPMFRRVQEAYEVLRDPTLRRQYDAEQRWTGIYSSIFAWGR